MLGVRFHVSQLCVTILNMHFSAVCQTKNSPFLHWQQNMFSSIWFSLGHKLLEPGSDGIIKFCVMLRDTPQSEAKYASDCIEFLDSPDTRSSFMSIIFKACDSVLCDIIP